MNKVNHLRPGYNDWGAGVVTWNKSHVSIINRFYPVCNPHQSDLGQRAAVEQNIPAAHWAKATPCRCGFSQPNFSPWDSLAGLQREHPTFTR